jgi:glucosamine--fructose-6-phosphate aminotransferase (isomerizing)
MRELKAKGAKVLGICNVQGSTVAREVDSCLFLRAGPEVGVASTKAFTSQLIVLTLFMLRLARMRTMSQKEGKQLIHALAQLPAQIKEVLAQEEAIRRIAKKYARYEDFFFLGRRFMYPTALEGALKLKEIAYVNANGYPAGEIKHGPIALISSECPTVAFTSDAETYTKMFNNLKEVKARNGLILAIANQGSTDILDVADDVIWVPSTPAAELTPFLATVATQLFAYHVALERGTEIDQPRNLAKSVTVE